MLSGVMLAVGSFGGGDIGNVLASWENLGVFSYALPFLLIFAMVYGVLTQTKIFKENRGGVNAIIALVVALMALQFDFVSTFFSEFFPRVGVGLVVILGALIILGLFTGPKLGSGIMFGLAGVIFLIVVFQSFGDLGTTGGNFLINYWPNLLVAALIIGAFIVIIATSAPKKDKPYDASLYAKSLGYGK